MKAFALLAVAMLQTVNPSPRELLTVERPLTNAEIAIVLAASRAALAGKTLRLPSLFNGQGPELRMGPAGLPRVSRSVSTIEGGIVYGIAPGSTSAPSPEHWTEEITRITDYTGEPARRCDGSPAAGEMVIEYEGRGATPLWSASARARDARDVGGLGIAPVFEMLRGAGSLASTERRQIAGRPARAFAATWALPGGGNVERIILRGDPTPNVIGEPAPEESMQTLWIDTESLLPLRWEVNKRGDRSHGFDLTYVSIDLQPPAGVEAPSCIR
jgi:hypothetical protein